jgi:hypothetical protein
VGVSCAAWFFSVILAVVTFFLVGSTAGMLAKVVQTGNITTQDFFFKSDRSLCRG